MNSLEFYKEIFEKELVRNKDLDAAVNAPIGLTTLIIGLMSYVYNKINFHVLEFSGALAVLILTSLIFVIYFLSKSYNNLFRGYNYINLPHTEELRNYEKKIEDYNQKVDECERMNFEEYLAENYVTMADNNGKVNRRRYYQLYLAKTTLMISIVLSMILLFVYLYKEFKL